MPPKPHPDLVNHARAAVAIREQLRAARTEDERRKWRAILEQHLAKAP